MKTIPEEMSQIVDKQNVSTKKCKFLALFAVAALAALLSPPLASATPILGDQLATFAVLAAAGVTSADTGSTIGGNLGSSGSSTSLTGIYNFTPLTGPVYNFTGSANPGTEALAQLQLDAAILAVNAHVASLANTIAAGNLNLQNFQSTQIGNVISPGTYAVGAGASNFDSTITLDGGGSNTAVWYFEFSSTLITGVNSNVLVQNVGDGAGVGIYWTVADAATLNGPTFAGNVLANNLIRSDGNLTIDCGRLLSANGQVTLIDDNISIGACGSGGFDQRGDIGSGGQVVPEPSTMLLLGAGLCGLALLRKRSRK